MQHGKNGKQPKQNSATAKLGTASANGVDMQADMLTNAKENSKVVVEGM